MAFWRRTALLGISLLVPSIVLGSALDEPTPGELAARSIAKEITVKVEMDYLLYLPENYVESDEKFPLLLFLHGAGETGNNLEQVKMHGPPKLLQAGKDLPFVVVAPQAREFGWKPEMLTALLDEVVANYRIDPDRVYVTGLSMGGMGTLALAAHTPDRFAAIAPICGPIRNINPSKIKDLPIWVFHGAKDSVVPVEGSRDLVKRLEELGAQEVKYTEYPEADHDSWTESYNNQELFDWLLSHKRSSKD